MRCSRQANSYLSFTSQDLITWTSFMEGKLPKEIFLLQSHQLMSSPSCLTIADWGKQLISQILQMSHAQWVFCNISLYDGTMATCVSSSNVLCFARSIDSRKWTLAPCQIAAGICWRLTSAHSWLSLWRNNNIGFTPCRRP